MPPTLGKKNISDDEDSDDMGTSKVLQQKQVKKRKKNTIKRIDEEDSIDSVSTPIKKGVTSPSQVPPPIPKKLPLSPPSTTRTLTAEDEKSEKKKTKKEKKPKQKATLKKKAPLDLDRQCGVLIAPNNNPCTRSLTCKIHAMGAKRAVEGRTHPFNELLAAYQKKGIGRPQVPGSVNDNQPHPKKDSNTKPKSSYLAESTTKSSQSQQQLANQPPDLKKEKEETIDSDEETENVRIAIQQSRPHPLGKKQVYYTRRKREYYKLRDILLEAITPKNIITSASGSTNTTNKNSNTLSSAADFSQPSMDQIIY